MWLGAAIAVVASLLLTTLAAALESSINGPGTRTVAPPVLWALGGGAGLVLGAVVASWLIRRAWPGILAAVVGSVPFLVLVILGYNSTDLDGRGPDRRLADRRGAAGAGGGDAAGVASPRSWPASSAAGRRAAPGSRRV